MLKPTKEAFLKHDLFKLNLPISALMGIFTLENIPIIKTIKVLSKGTKFIYCETDLSDGNNGWYNSENTGFDFMSDNWAKENLTEPINIFGKNFVPRNSL